MSQQSSSPLDPVGTVSLDGRMTLDLPVSCTPQPPPPHRCSVFAGCCHSWHRVFSLLCTTCCLLPTPAVVRSDLPVRGGSVGAFSSFLFLYDDNKNGQSANKESPESMSPRAQTPLLCNTCKLRLNHILLLSANSNRLHGMCGFLWPQGGAVGPHSQLPEASDSP